MAYDERLAERIREQLQGTTGLGEKKMFGGIAFLVGGNMACGVRGPDMIVRLSPEQHEAALKKPHVRPFDMTGRPMKGWVVVAPEGCKTKRQLQSWVRQGVNLARSLPEK